MAIIRDQPSDEDRLAEELSERLDLSQLCCPKCGCNDVEVVSYPTGTPPRRTADGWQGSWFGGSGKAECNFCGAQFQVELAADEDEDFEP